MGIRSIFASIALVSITILSCHKLCTPKQLSFTGGVANVLPDKDSIQIGDTIWFNASIPVNYKFWGGYDSVVYNLSGAKNVETDIHLTTLVVPHQPIGAIDSFLFVVKKGIMKLNPLAPHFAQTISFNEENNTYTFNLGIIALKKGVYALAIVDIYQAMKNCDKVSVTITMNDPDSHLHYLKDIFYGGGEVYPIDSTHTYCFKVY